MKRITIAVDGYSSCGKSTMAKYMAKTLAYTYVDTGAMYRSVALYAIRNKLINDSIVNEDQLRADISKIELSFDTRGNVLLNGEDVSNEIRSLEVSRFVSHISALPFVRSRMVEIQRKMGKNGGVVMDGRDIGTVVFPKAELKIFVTADAGVRAKRRFDEMRSNGKLESYEDILENIKQRDYMDEHRQESPLRKAEDAIVLDNSNMSIEEQNRWLMSRYAEKCKN
ncbi:MAG TPA: (d)CMP kinase [Candidatus Enterocola sp.]|nr:(d)CMP kinase [Candidatus Enterocola sp.]